MTAHDDGTVTYNDGKRSVTYDKDGYPDFSSYMHPDTSRNMADIGSFDPNKQKNNDFTAANKKMGWGNSYKYTPDGWTWHHLQDGHTLILVPTEVNDNFRHATY